MKRILAVSGRYKGRIQQFLMGAYIGHGALLQHTDLVCIHNGVEPVGDDEDPSNWRLVSQLLWKLSVNSRDFSPSRL